MLGKPLKRQLHHPTSLISPRPTPLHSTPLHYTTFTTGLVRPTGGGHGRMHLRRHHRGIPDLQQCCPPTPRAPTHAQILILRRLRIASTPTACRFPPCVSLDAEQVAFTPCRRVGNSGKPGRSQRRFQGSHLRASCPRDHACVDRGGGIGERAKARNAVACRRAIQMVTKGGADGRTGVRISTFSRAVGYVFMAGLSGSMPSVVRQRGSRG